MHDLWEDFSSVSGLCWSFLGVSRLFINTGLSNFIGSILSSPNPMPIRVVKGIMVQPAAGKETATSPRGGELSPILPRLGPL